MEYTRVECLDNAIKRDTMLFFSKYWHLWVVNSHSQTCAFLQPTRANIHRYKLIIPFLYSSCKSKIKLL